MSNRGARLSDIDITTIKAGDMLVIERYDICIWPSHECSRPIPNALILGMPDCLPIKTPVLMIRILADRPRVGRFSHVLGIALVAGHRVCIDVEDITRGWLGRVQ